MNELAQWTSDLVNRCEADPAAAAVVLAVAYSMLVEDDSEVSGFDIGRHALLQKVVGAAGQLGTADPGAHLAAFNGMVGALRPQTHQGAGGNDPSDATPLGTQGHLGPRPWPFA